MKTLFNPFQFIKVPLQYKPRLSLAPWDNQTGTVPYNVNNITSTTINGHHLTNYWKYGEVSISKDIF